MAKWRRRGAQLLTAIEVTKAKTPGMYADGGNLYLRIGPTGAKSWIFRYQRDGRRHDMGLGPVSLYPLAELRDKVIDLRRGLRDGIDPIDQQRAAKAEAKVIEVIHTFATVAEDYIAQFSPTWSNAKHAGQWRATLATYISPVIGKTPIGEVDTSAVLEVLNPIWLTKPETASRCRGRIEAIINFARSKKLCQGENPAQWKGHLENLLPKRSAVASARVQHHAALPYTEIVPFMTQLRSRGGVAAAALEFAILTCARTGEVLGAKWTEVDLERRIWIIPAERMKGRREHRAPLADAALAVLECMQNDRRGDYIFPGQSPGKPLSNMALLMLLRKMGRGDLTAHGFRSTARDWMAESTNFPSEVCEFALAHVVGDKVEAAYRRGDLFDKRRALAEAWAAACDAPQNSDVVVLNTRRT
jgi:integrase